MWDVAEFEDEVGASIAMHCSTIALKEMCFLAGGAGKEESRREGNGECDEECEDECERE